MSLSDADTALCATGGGYFGSDFEARSYKTRPERNSNLTSVIRGRIVIYTGVVFNFRKRVIEVM